ncbi:MAG: HAMP domain-containing protein [Rhodospirillales bacterium]|nr:HAMP domain-containing protein [Rhodospirillales bacterium]
MLGIRGRLFMAFGGVAAMTVLAGLVSWFSYAQMSESLNRIISNDIPAMTSSAQLAEKGAAIIATAPTLISAQSETERAAAWADLKATLSEMSDQVGTMDTSLPGNAVKVRLPDLMNKVGANLSDLDVTVRRGFWFQERNNELTERLRFAQADFLDEVEPMVEDARFNIETAMDQAKGTGNPAIIETQRTVLRAETRRREALLKVNAAGNLAVGLIARAASLPDTGSLDQTYLYLGEVSGLMAEEMKALADLPASVSLVQVADAMLAFGIGGDNLFQLRRDELANIEEGRRLLAVNRDLVERLQGVIAEQVEAVHATIQAAADASRATVSRGKALLLAVAAASLAVAVLVAWLYVGRNLVRRITALGQSMRKIAAGNLGAEVATGGNDEISDMAEALKTFRDTAAEVQAELVQAGKMAALGQLSAGISHELNQPLAALTSYAHNTRVLLDRGRTREAEENLERISELTERMAKITNHLKTFARRPPDKIEKADLNSVITNALSFFDSRIRTGGVTVNRHRANGAVVVRGDEIRLEQVLINLFSNALDAMEETEPRTLDVIVEETAGTVDLVIRDTGKGLGEDELKQIFDPFFTTKEVGEGLGLGLSISYNIIKDFDGTLRASSEAGIGTSFSIKLPRGT